MASSNRRRIKNDIHKLLMDVKIFDDDPLGQVEKEGGKECWDQGVCRKTEKVIKVIPCMLKSV
jgi:hypothetical protein